MKPEDKRVLEEQLVVWDELLRSRGWAEMVKFLKGVEEKAYSMMMLANNPHESTKHLGVYHAAKVITAWPQQSRDVIHYQLKGGLE